MGRRAEGAGVTVRDAVVVGRDGAIRVCNSLSVPRSPNRPLLWLHCGEFSTGQLDQGESDAATQAWAAKSRWLRTVDYHFVPRVSLYRDHAFREGLHRFSVRLHDGADVIIASTDAADMHADAGGASAGANFDAATALLRRDSAGPPLHRLALANGTTYHSASVPRPELRDRPRGLPGRWTFSPAEIRRINLNSIGDERLHAPSLAFPARINLRDFPPTLILHVENDRPPAPGRTFAAGPSGAARSRCRGPRGSGASATRLPRAAPPRGVRSGHQHDARVAHQGLGELQLCTTSACRRPGRATASKCKDRRLVRRPDALCSVPAYPPIHLLEAPE